MIDVGMDRDENGKLCGDVDFDSAKRSCRLYHSCARRRRADDDCNPDAQYIDCGKGTKPYPIKMT